MIRFVNGVIGGSPALAVGLRERSETLLRESRQCGTGARDRTWKPPAYHPVQVMQVTKSEFVDGDVPSCVASDE
jgi:hypothetical protein